MKQREIDSIPWQPEVDFSTFQIPPGNRALAKKILAPLGDSNWFGSWSHESTKQRIDIVRKALFQADLKTD